MRYFLVELTVTGTIEEATLIAQRAFLQKMNEEGHLAWPGVYRTGLVAALPF